MSLDHGGDRTVIWARDESQQAIRVVVANRRTGGRVERMFSDVAMAAANDPMRLLVESFPDRLDQLAIALSQVSRAGLSAANASRDMARAFASLDRSMDPGAIPPEGPFRSAGRRGNSREGAILEPPRHAETLAEPNSALPVYRPR